MNSVRFLIRWHQKNVNPNVIVLNVPNALWKKKKTKQARCLWRVLAYREFADHGASCFHFMKKWMNIWKCRTSVVSMGIEIILFIG